MTTKEYFMGLILSSKERLMVQKRLRMKIRNSIIIVSALRRVKIFWLLNFLMNRNGECKLTWAKKQLIWLYILFIFIFLLNSTGEVTDCGQYLIVTAVRDCSDNLVFFCDLSSLPDKTICGKLELTTVVDKMDADYEVSVILNNAYNNLANNFFDLKLTTNNEITFF